MAQVRKKAHPLLFNKVAAGEKKFDLRLADFEVKPGDTLILEEWDPATKSYTGRKIEKKVTYVLKTKDCPFWTNEEAEEYGYQVIQLE
jgi:ribosomal protein S17